MNKIILIGRIVRDCELNELNEKKYLKNSIAVQREIKNKEGNYDTDFFNFTVWNKQAEYLHNYCKKGDLISVIGRLQNRSYEKDGQKINVNEILVNEIKILTPHYKEKSNEELNQEVADKLGDDVIEFLD